MNSFYNLLHCLITKDFLLSYFEAARSAVLCLSLFLSCIYSFCTQFLNLSIIRKLMQECQSTFASLMSPGRTQWTLLNFESLGNNNASLYASALVCFSAKEEQQGITICSVSTGKWHLLKNYIFTQTFFKWHLHIWTSESQYIVKQQNLQAIA